MTQTRITRKLALLALCMATAALSQTAPAQYRLVSIDIPGATGTGPGLPGALAYGIDNAGVVTGLYNDANNITHAFAWKAGTLKTLDHPGAAYSAFSSVSINW